MKPTVVYLALVAGLAVGSAGCDQEPTDVGVLGFTQSQLTAEQCEFFASGSQVQICHRTNSAKNPWVIIRTNLQGCLAGHAGHAEDYVPFNDPTCNGLGCYPIGAPADASAPCCDPLVADASGHCACPEGGCIGSGQSVTAAAGAEARLEGVSFDVPAGSVDLSITSTLHPPPTQAKNGAAIVPRSQVFELGPSGTTFDPPLVIAFLVGPLAADTTVFTVQDEADAALGINYEEVDPLDVVVAGDYLLVSVRHFSFYNLGQSPCSGKVVGQSCGSAPGGCAAAPTCQQNGNGPLFCKGNYFAGGTPCSDGNPCTSNDTCPGGGGAGAGVCAPGPFNTDPCDDGDPDTSNDVCDGAGACYGSAGSSCNAAGAPFGGGTGTAADPYLVCTLAHLQAVNGVVAEFKQTADLDLGGTPFDGPVVTTLAGTYDGGGKTIRNLSITKIGPPAPPQPPPVGLFSFVVAGGAVKNLHLQDVAITTGAGRTGALVGQLDAGASVSDCSVRGGFVTNTLSQGQTGGLIGQSQGIVERSHAAVQVTALDSQVGGLIGVVLTSCGVIAVSDSSATGDVTKQQHNPGGGNSAGGLIGRLNGGTVVRSFATGTVTGNKLVGGLIGTLRSSVEDCYALGSVELYGPAWGSAEGAFGGAFGGDWTGSTCTVDVTRVYTAATSVPLPLEGYSWGTQFLLFGTGAFSGGDIAYGLTLPNYVNDYYWEEPANPGSVPVYSRGVIRDQWTSSEGMSAPGITGLANMTVQANFAGFDFSPTGPWRMPTANPLAPGGLLSPVLAWQCGRDGVVCAP